MFVGIQRLTGSLGRRGACQCYRHLFPCNGRCKGSRFRLVSYITTQRFFRPRGLLLIFWDGSNPHGWGHTDRFRLPVIVPAHKGSGTGHQMSDPPFSLLVFCSRLQCRAGHIRSGRGVGSHEIGPLAWAVGVDCLDAVPIAGIRLHRAVGVARGRLTGVAVDYRQIHLSRLCPGCTAVSCSR